MLELFLVLAVSYAFTYASVPWLIPRLLKAKISGKDMNKNNTPEIAEMGGFAIIAGFIVGLLLVIGLSTFGIIGTKINLPILLASLSTILIMAVIGIIDDLFLIRQQIKAILPIFASLPLVAVSAGVSHMHFPLIGVVELGLIYPLILIPIAITGASNATNMLAGFNGLEAGLGAVMLGTIGIVSYSAGRTEAVILSFAMLGALLAFLKYNWYPARIFIGDIGTLIIGATVAVSVIAGNIEKIGIILILPFVLELYLKARGRFNSQSWCKLQDDKLICPKRHEIHGLGRLVMYLTGGIKEKPLVITLILMESVFAIIALISTFMIS